MKSVLVISSSPNTDGLTAACAASAGEGAHDAGLPCEAFSLNEMRLERCRVCGGGWGTCREGHVCCIGDDFDALQRKIADAGSLVVITPVYWGESSEPHKAFFDRLRRCEALAGQSSRLAGKPVVLVAAAGGSGYGTLSCLTQMEQEMRPMGAVFRDRISITRFTRDYQLDTIRAAVRSLGSL